ncbi:MAG: RNA polymerase sigma factor [Verrucomicrobiota bacterium]
MSPIDPDALDQADMARLRAGHDPALNALMDRHAGALFGFLCRWVGDDDTANDLSQETFVRVYQKRATFQEGQRFSTWLFTIAANLARNHLRARGRRAEVPLESGSGDEPGNSERPILEAGLFPDQQVALGEQQVAVRQAVSELPEDLREAVLLCELEDRSVAEAATLLHTTVKAVESRLYRARGRLRKQLSKWLSAP